MGGVELVYSDQDLLGASRIKNPARAPINILDYGADPTGTSNSSAAVLNAVTASVRGNTEALYSGGIYIPAGIYTGNVDLSTVFAGAVVQGWFIIADPGALWIGSWKISPGNTGSMWHCNLRLPQLYGRTLAANTDGLTIAGIYDSDIDIPSVRAFTRDGVVFDCSGAPPFGIFNNRIRIGPTSANTGCGVNIKGNNGAAGYGFQGNIVFLQHPAANGSHGLVVDSNGTGLNSEWNTFHIGASEYNTGDGILDNNGKNFYRISNTNNNAKGFVLGAGATGTPDIIGCITDGYNLNGGKAHYLDLVLGELETLFGGQLLMAPVSYQPVGATLVAATPNSTTTVDAANLITGSGHFPASGKVDVILEAVAYINQAAGAAVNELLEWCVYDAVSASVLGTARIFDVLSPNPTPATAQPQYQVRAKPTIRITGSPYAAFGPLTWQQWLNTPATGACGVAYGGGTTPGGAVYGAARMEVRAAQ